LASKERIDVLLVELGLCPTRERARARILAGDAVVDDHRVDKPGTRVNRDAVIRLKGDDMPWVSRGGLKLAHALDTFGITLDGAVALDVGASTGGFTQVMLSRGATRVYAVDVGWGQLAEPVRTHPSVVNLERTHVKDLPALHPPPSFCSIDVSFISLRLVLPHVLRVLTRPGHVVALVKPQFEVGRGQVGSGGIVRDPAAREDALARVLQDALALGLVERGRTLSPITGQKGNVEFLVHWSLG